MGGKGWIGGKDWMGGKGKIFFLLPVLPVLPLLAFLPTVAAQRSADSVPAQTCGGCHTQIHEAWTIGRHSKMLQPATDSTVKGDFKGSVSLRGHTYGLRVRNGQYFVVESDLTGTPREHRVEYTLGSRRIQHYLTTVDKGWIVVLPATWDVDRREWFHNADIIRPDEDDRLAVQQWNRSCVGCHVSGQDNGYDPATRTFHTTWSDFGTSCERCHGPGRRHVDTYRSPEASRSTAEASRSIETEIVRLTRLDPNSSVMVCAQCHSLRTAINPNYKAGDNYYDFFVPTLEFTPHARPHASQDPPYWPDGRPRRFSNDAIGLWQSACFLKGGATCVTCHNPHLPNVDQSEQLAGAASDALCTRCHQKIGAQRSQHTRHRADSSGSACVECHMPRTVLSIKARMRDHTISVPAPENTVRFGVPNACTECHADKPASWAADAVRSWGPSEGRARLVAQAEAFSAARSSRPEAIEPLVAIGMDGRYPPLIRANAVAYLARFDDARAIAALVRAATSDDPAIRLQAIAGMRDAARNDPAARAAARAALTDSRRAVRIAALLTLVEQARGDLTPTELAQFRYVAGEMAMWAGENAFDADLPRLHGIVQLLAGDPDRAAVALSISLDLEPQAQAVRFFLALARLAQRQVDEARALLQAIPRTDPYYEKAQERLRGLAVR